MSNPNRDPKGIPTGGQFAAGKRAEGGEGVELTLRHIDGESSVAMNEALWERGVEATADDVRTLVDKGWSHDETFSKALDAGYFDDGMQNAPRLVDLSSPQIESSLESAPTYRKTSVIDAEQATEPTTLTTTLADGTVETTREVKVGDWIVTNPGGERYAMGADKFASRYAPNGDGRYAATGRVIAMSNPEAEPIAIVSPWGDMMRGDDECMIAAQPDENGRPGSDRYIIGRDEFDATYAPLD